jgi:hypothetical protein
MLNIDRGWADLNAGSQYPFADGATLQADDGAAFPVGVITDATVGAPSVDGATWLRVVDVGADSITMTFAQGDTDLAAVTISASTSGWVDLVDLIGSRVYAGRVEIDSNTVGAAFAMGRGSHVFSAAASALVPYAVFAAPIAGLSSIITADVEMTGDITLIVADGLEAKLRDDGAVVISATGLPYRGRVDTELIPRGISVVNVVVEKTDGSPPVEVSVRPAKGAIGADVATITDAATKASAVTITASGDEISIEVSS